MDIQFICGLTIAIVGSLFAIVSLIDPLKSDIIATLVVLKGLKIEFFSRLTFWSATLSLLLGISTAILAKFYITLQAVQFLVCLTYCATALTVLSFFLIAHECVYNWSPVTLAAKAISEVGLSIKEELKEVSKAEETFKLPDE